VNRKSYLALIISEFVLGCIRQLIKLKLLRHQQIYLTFSRQTSYFSHHKSKTLKFKFFILFFFCFLISGCAFFADPSCRGDVAECPEDEWIPPYRINRKELYCKEEIPENEELGITQLIDYGLRHNPTTKNTWNTARSNAYILFANYNTLYPHVTGSQEIELVKSHFNGGLGGASLRAGAVGGIIDATSALNNANNVTSPGTPFGGGVIPLGGGGVGGFGPVYNQFLITDISASYIMLDFGGRQANIEAARQALYMANWTHNRNLQTVILTILQAYYNYNAAVSTVEAQLQNLKDATQNLESAKTMYEVGVAPRVDFLQARAAFVNAQLLLEQAYNNRNTTMGQLATAIGIKADEKIKVTSIPEKLPEIKIEEDMHTLLMQAKDERPDLAASYSNYLNALEQITVQYSSGMPVVGAFGDYQKVNFIHDPQFNGYISSAGIVATAPLFDGFLARNLTKAARAQAKAAYAAYKSAEEQAFLDVITSYYAFKTAIQTVKYSKEYLDFAQEAYDVASTGYREGVNSLLDVLTASVTLANARTSYIQSRTQYLTSIASLAYATGTLHDK
jgi:outer membrane protein TolC